MNRIVALDLDSSPKRTYAVYLHNSKYAGQQLHSGVTRNFLSHILASIKPDVVIVDNLSELREIFGLLPQGTALVEMCRRTDSSFVSIEELASSTGLPTLQHPSPDFTVRLMVSLLLKGHGTVVEWDNRAQRLRFYPLDRLEEKSVSILGSGHERELVKVAGRELRKPIDFLETYVEVGIVDEFVTIGKGKEAEVFLCTFSSGEPVVTKVYYKFSSTTKSTRISGVSRDDWRLPSVLAATERRNLRWMEKHSLPVPHVIHRDGPALFLEAIVTETEDSLTPAPSLLDVDLSEHGHPLDFFDMLIDTLYRLFVDAEMVHGDFSPPNILFDGEELRVIDAVQARRYYFGEPMGDLVDYEGAKEVLSRDVNSICRHFQQKYRVFSDAENIVEEITKEVT